jgi:hypothetical protein
MIVLLSNVHGLLCDHKTVTVNCKSAIFILTFMLRHGIKTNENEFTYASRLVPHAYFHLNSHGLIQLGQSYVIHA